MNMSQLVMRPWIGLAALGFGMALAAPPSVQPEPVPDAGKILREKRAQIFTENRGQWDGQARFLSAQPGMNYWVTGNGIVFDLHRYNKQGSETVKSGHVVQVTFDGANRRSTTQGVEMADLRQSFYVGGQEDWAVDVRAFGEAYQQNIYENVHARHYRTENGLRYDLIVMPGGNVGDIKMRVSGADGVTLDDNGNLRIGTSLGAIKQDDLYVYQPVGNQVRRIPAEFVVNGDVITFQVGSYDKRLPLIIDPLVYGTYVGSDAIPFFSTGDEQIDDLTADASGNVYMAGSTSSITFPILAGAYQESQQGGRDAYMLRLRGDAYALDYATYYGGSANDFALGIALNSDATAVFIAGITLSPNLPGANLFTDANDPGAQANTRAGANAYFISRFNIASNGAITGAFSRYYNRPGVATALDDFKGFKVSGVDTVHLAGQADNGNLVGGTNPGNAMTPFLPGAGGGDDGWVASFDESGNVTYQTIVGGPGDEAVGSMDVNAGGRVVLTGGVGFAGTQDTSTAPNPAFPTTAGVFPNGRLIRNSDAFIVTLDPAGAALRSAVFGSSGLDGAQAAAFDSNSNIYITGTSGTPDFPRTIGAFDQNSSLAQQFLSKFNGDLSAISYSTLLSTTGNVVATQIDVDARGYAYVAGTLGFTANPPDANGNPTPATPGSIAYGRSRIPGIDNNYNGGDDAVFPPNTPDWANNAAAFPASTDAFIMVLNPSGTEAAYIDSLGENGDEFATALHVDTVGACWIAGQIVPVFNAQNGRKNPHGLGQYITTNAFRTQPGFGDQDAWAVKLRIDLPILQNITLPPPGAIAGGLGANTTATISLRDPAPAGGVTINVTLSDPNVASFTPTPGNVTTVVTIPAGATTGTVQVFSLPVTSQQTVDIRATLDNDFKVARLTVAPWLSDLTVAPSTTPGGNNVSVRVVLFQNAIADVRVPVSANDNTLITLPSPPEIVVPAGSSTATVSMATAGVVTNQDVTVSGNLLGVNRSATVTLLPAVLSNIAFNPSRINGGETSTMRVELNGKAGNDRTIDITQLTALPNVTVNGNAVPTQVVIPAQQRFVDVTVGTPQVGSTTNLTLRATEGAVTVQGTLVLDDIDLLRIEITPSTNVLGGSVLTGVVRLTRAAGPSGFLINLSNSNANAGTLSTATVNVAPNQLVSAPFTFTTLAVNVLQTTTITASKPGGFTPRTIEITVRPLNLTLSLAPTSLRGGSGPSVATATISEPAPFGGIPLALSSSDTTAAQPAASNVTIPEGATQVTFLVNTFAVPTNRNVTITATASPLVSASANLEVLAPVIQSLQVNPIEVNGGDGATGTIILNGNAPVGGLAIALSANPTGIATFPGTVTVPAGSNTVTFPITTVSIPVTTLVTFTATLNGVNSTDTLLVRGPQVNTIVFNPARVRGGRQSVGTITLSQPAPAGGYTVTIESLNPEFAVPVGSATITIPAGALQGTFRVATSRVSRSIAVRFRASGLDSEATGVIYLIP